MEIVWPSMPWDEGNDISYNNIHDVMMMLGDGGSIYTLGPQGNVPFPKVKHHRRCCFLSIWFSDVILVGTKRQGLSKYTIATTEGSGAVDDDRQLYS